MHTCIHTFMYADSTVAIHFRKQQEKEDRERMQREQEALEEARRLEEEREYVSPCNTPYLHVETYNHSIRTYE